MPDSTHDIARTDYCSRASLIVIAMLAASCSSDGESPVVSLRSATFGPAPILDEAAAVPDPVAPTIRKVLIIAVDGLRADKVDNSDGKRLTIPNFERLQRDGIFVLESHQERVPGGAYRTCPGFIQMTTGKRIAAHGVEGNGDCSEGRFREYPIFFRRLKQLRPDIRIAVAEPTEEVGQIILGSCGGIAQLSSCLDVVTTFDYSHAGDLAGRDRVLQWIRAGYDVVWYHPHEVDRQGHDHGWEDSETDGAVERLDEEVLGPLLTAIDAREKQTRERWMVIVAADHGGHDRRWGTSGDHTTKESDKKVPIIVSGTLIPDEGERPLNAFRTWDLPATIFDFLGLTPNPSWPSTDGTSILNAN